jgi:hypothetical protein
MTLLEFLKRAHRWTGGAPIPGLRDPLEALASLVRTTPASPRARVVLRVLIALRNNAGEFEESDLWALDAEAQGLLTALVSDQLPGVTPKPNSRPLWERSRRRNAEAIENSNATLSRICIAIAQDQQSPAGSHWIVCDSRNLT